MVSDSIPTPSIPMASSNPKDFAKKKRANWSAKLKQCKLDARREQWLSQGSSSSSFSSCSGSGGCCSGSLSEEDDNGDDDDCMDDWEAVADALAATDQKLKQHHPGSDSCLERDESLHFCSRADVSNGVTENDTAKKKSEYRGLTSRHPVSYTASKPDDAFCPQILPNMSKQYSFPMNLEQNLLLSAFLTFLMLFLSRGSFGNNRPTFTLPRPHDVGLHWVVVVVVVMNLEQNCCGGAVFGCQRLSVPTSCPICCEDLDFTDTSFLPCTCGFVLCLFYRKKILEEDGRCPGCRKQYNHEPVEGEATLDGGSLKFRLARSCSMISRS